MCIETDNGTGEGRKTFLCCTASMTSAVENKEALVGMALSLEEVMKFFVSDRKIQRKTYSFGAAFTVEIVYCIVRHAPKV